VGADCEAGDEVEANSAISQTGRASAQCAGATFRRAEGVGRLAAGRRRRQRLITMLKLSDSELDPIHRLSWPLAPQDRAACLDLVAAKLTTTETIVPIPREYFERICLRVDQCYVRYRTQDALTFR